GEGGGGRRDDVGVAAHRGPGARTVLRIDDHARSRVVGGIAIEGAHLVVDEVDVVDGRVEGTQRLAQRGVEGVDGSVPVGGRGEGLPVYLDLDPPLREALA